MQLPMTAKYAYLHLEIMVIKAAENSNLVRVLDYIYYLSLLKTDFNILLWSFLLKN